MYLSPSFICMDLFNLKEQFEELYKSPLIKSIHYDIMDMHFVPRVGSDIHFLKQLTEKQPLPIDDIEKLADAGTYSVTFHPEITKDIHQIIEQIRAHNMKVGLALRPHTKLDTILHLLNEIDMLTIMGCSPGVFGSKPTKDFMDRVYEAPLMTKKHNTVVYVDTGVTMNTLPILSQRNIHTAVVGNSTLFAPNTILSEQLKQLEQQFLPKGKLEVC